MKFYRPEKYHDECFGTLFLYGQATSVIYISCSTYWKELYTLHNSISIGFSLHLLLLDNKILVDSSDLFLKSTGSKPHTFGRTMKIFVEVILIRIVWNIKHIRLVMKDNYQQDKISIKYHYIYIYCLGPSTYKLRSLFFIKKIMLFEKWIFLLQFLLMENVYAKENKIPNFAGARYTDDVSVNITGNNRRRAKSCLQ